MQGQVTMLSYNEIFLFGGPRFTSALVIVEREIVVRIQVPCCTAVLNPHLFLVLPILSLQLSDELLFTYLVASYEPLQPNCPSSRLVTTFRPASLPFSSLALIVANMKLS